MRRLITIITVLMTATMLTGCIGNPYKAGIKNLEKGEYSEAAEEFKEAIEDEKHLADSYRGLGIALWEEKDYEGAFTAFEQAISEGTEVTATIYNLMGNCLMELQKYESAAEYYELAIAREDISEELKREARYNLIAAYEYAGKVDKAKETVKEYIADYPDDEEVLREADFLETR